MYYLMKVYERRGEEVYKIGDTTDGVAEVVDRKTLDELLNRGTDIKGIVTLDDGSLFFVKLNPKNFTDISKMGEVFPYKDVQGVLTRYNSESDVDFILTTGDIAKKVFMPRPCNYGLTDLERNALVLQNAINNLREASKKGKNTFSFSEAASVLGISCKRLWEIYESGALFSFRYGYWQRHFQSTSEQMFSAKELYRFLEKEVGRFKENCCYTKEKLIDALKQEGIYDKKFLDSINKFMSAIIMHDGRELYSQTQFDFLKVMYEKTRIVS